MPFGVDAVTFLVSSLLLFSIRRHDRSPAPATDETTFRSELMAGFRWLVQDAIMPRLIGVVVGLSFADGMAGGILILVALRNLSVTETGYGVLLGVAALGGVAGPLCVAPLVRRFSVKQILLATTVIGGGCYVVMGLLLAPAVAGLMLALNSATTMMWNVLTVSARQRLIPRELLGRVTTLYQMAAWGSLSVGTLAGGVLTGELGARPVIVVAGVMIVALTALVSQLPRVSIEVPRPTRRGVSDR
ncbi:MAG: MFS transporter [Pseudonocardiaceae bacterium]